MFAFVLLPLDSAWALYLVLFGVLVLSGIGLPIPEEVTLLLGGYLAYLEFTHYWTTVYVLIAGILAADTIGYFLGRFAGGWLWDKLIKISFTRILLEKAKEYFDRYGEKIVLFSRPLVGVRVAIPIFAGHLNMQFGRFILFDTLAAVPWTFFLVTLSYYLGTGLDLITEVKEIKHAVLALIGVGFLVYAGIKFIQKERD